MVTFTDAATQELRERIRSRLGEAARCFAEPQERHDGLLVALRQQYPAERWPGCARLLRLAAEWMDEAAVSTIHSWCYRMLREHAFDSGSLFTQNLETDQSELLAEVVRDYWRRNFYGLTAPAAQAVASCYSGPEALGKALQPLLARQDADFRYADQALSAPESLAALLEQGGDWYRQLDQLDAQARAAWRAARVELEALLRDLRPYLNGNSYRGKDSDETFDAWLQALADWSEGGEQPANLGKFGQTRIKLTAKRVAPEHAALRAIDAWAAHQEERPDLAPHLLLHALGEVGRELEVEKQRRAEIGFDDLLSRLDRALQAWWRAPGAIDPRAVPGGADRRVPGYRPGAVPDLRAHLPDRRRSRRAPGAGNRPVHDRRPQAGDLRLPRCRHPYLPARPRGHSRAALHPGKNFRSTAAMVAAANRCFAFAEEHPRGAFRFAREGLENPVPFHAVDAQGRAERLLIDGAEAPAMTFWNLDAEAGVLGSAAYRQEMAERSASAIRRWLSLADLGRAASPTSRAAGGRCARRISPSSSAVAPRPRRSAARWRRDDWPASTCPTATRCSTARKPPTCCTGCAPAPTPVPMRCCGSPWLPAACTWTGRPWND